MSKKAEEYSFNIPSELFNELDNPDSQLLWKKEIEEAFDNGYKTAVDKVCEIIRKQMF